MTTPVEKRDNTKFCEFHGEVGHNTNECMHLKRQIEELLKAGKLSHLIKELKQNKVKDQPKAAKKGETSSKDKALTILMVRPWHKVARQKNTQSFSLVSEISFPPLGEEEGTEGPMIIEAELPLTSSASATKLYGRWGQIALMVKIRDEEHSTSAMMNFMVVRSQSPYKGIIERPGVRNIKATTSTAHDMLKFLVEGGVLTLKSSRIVPLECAMVSGPEGQPATAEQPAEERIKVAIHPEYPEQTVSIGSTLTEERRGKLCDPLKRNWDVFSWKLADMTGVPRHIAEHHLNVREGCFPVRQKKKGQASERNKAIHWRMCVDFKDLNKACRKDGYPLPEIDWKVESLYRNLEVYVDDLVIKSRTEDETIRDMEETFRTLKEINMKLNPKKRTFGVEEGMFIGLIADLPTLTAPMEKEELIIYLAAAKEAVSAVLMTEREAKQMPIYFVSRALRGPEINYTQMEKLVLALVHASKRLKRYFQAHTIIVITDQPIKKILSRPEVVGRLQKWSIELGEYDIQYRPRVSVKGQILADFIVDHPEDDSTDDLWKSKKNSRSHGSCSQMDHLAQMDSELG
ncbi:reverse transcriptase domain-containing protein [Tanacetum coccineum]